MIKKLLLVSCFVPHLCFAAEQDGRAFDSMNMEQSVECWRTITSITLCQQDQSTGKTATLICELKEDPFNTRNVLAYINNRMVSPTKNVHFVVAIHEMELTFEEAEKAYHDAITPHE